MSDRWLAPSHIPLGFGFANCLRRAVASGNNDALSFSMSNAYRLMSAYGADANFRPTLDSPSTVSAGVASNIQPPNIYEHPGEAHTTQSVPSEASSSDYRSAYSDRPIDVNERISMYFLNLGTHPNFFVGFTNFHPKAHNIGSYQSNIQHKEWIEEIDFVHNNDIFEYYYNSAGEVHYDINGEYKGILINSVDRNAPLWAYTLILKDAVLDSSPLLSDRSPQIQTVDIPRGESLSRNMRALTVGNSDQSHSDFIPLNLHRTKGHNVKIYQYIARRSAPETGYAYIFTAQPIGMNQTILIEILETIEAREESLAIGLTSCDPETLSSRDLPEDCESLYDRPEFWIVEPNAVNNVSPGDSLEIILTPHGEVRLRRNRSTSGPNSSESLIIWHVDITVPLWAFVNVVGVTRVIKMTTSRTPIPSAPSILDVSSSSAATSSATEPSRSNSEMPEEQSFTAGDPVGVECIICYSDPINSILYKCGHMCMCFKCATKQRFEGSGECPICRADIMDVIRTYRP